MAESGLRSAKEKRPVKHFVIRCEWSQKANAWRFVLIDPQSAQKVYAADFDRLQQELLQKLEQVSNEPSGLKS